MLSRREFLGTEFYAFCQKEFDLAREFLKNCGRPNSEHDRYMISFHKDTARIFKDFLHGSNS